MKIIFFISVICGIFLLNACSANDNLSGEWQGFYSYPNDIPDANFDMILLQKAADITGSTIEANTFGDPSSATLEALISGKVTGNRVDFIKTYNGKGGVSHSISYSGEISENFSHIKGTWTIPGSWSGKFEISRKSSHHLDLY